MLKIKWSDKIRNEEVYRRIDKERTLWNNIEKRRTRWIGHTLRDNGFMKKITEGKIEGKVPRGRPRNNYMGQIKKKVHYNKYQEVSQLSLDIYAYIIPCEPPLGRLAGGVRAPASLGMGMGERGRKVREYWSKVL
jgi:hypothetical protein